jgi:hypothetical protein
MNTMMILVTAGLCVAWASAMVRAQGGEEIWKVKKTTDFEVTGRGNAANWKKADWLVLPQRSSWGKDMETKVKTLYSSEGMYFLFSCEDEKLHATMTEDFMDLWIEDVVEVFLWPDEKLPAYFEYEISPLNRELPILISNDEGDLVRWQPFHYDADRKTRHETAVTGGKKESGAAITAWTAEFFIPFKLMRPLKNIAPKAGTRWHANFYRVDYDKGEARWSWQLTRDSFHDYERFGTLEFE